MIDSSNYCILVCDDLLVLEAIDRFMRCLKIDTMGTPSRVDGMPSQAIISRDYPGHTIVDNLHTHPVCPGSSRGSLNFSQDDLIFATQSGGISIVTLDARGRLVTRTLSSDGAAKALEQGHGWELFLDRLFGY